MVLKDKVIIVTGASQGIGFALAKGCAEEGATVIMVARRKEKLDAAAQELRALGLDCHAKQLDVTDEARISEVFDEIVREFGRIDGLINNAGLTSKVKFLDSTLEDYTAVLDSNLKSTYMCSKKAAALMLPNRKGAIVNISSVAARNGGGLMSTSLYSAAKGGIISFSKGIARELAPLGIRVNVLAPACIDTPATTVGRDPAEYQESIRKIPMHRRGSVDDVVAPAVLLLSDSAGFITGSTIDVNGGVYFY